MKTITVSILVAFFLYSIICAGILLHSGYVHTSVTQLSSGDYHKTKELKIKPNENFGYKIRGILTKVIWPIDVIYSSIGTGDVGPEDNERKSINAITLAAGTINADEYVYYDYLSFDSSTKYVSIKSRSIPSSKSDKKLTIKVE